VSTVFQINNFSDFLENSEKENSCLTLIELEHELKKLHFSLSRH